MSLCEKCVSGVRHEGTPEGKFEVINGVNTYVATPTVDYPKDKAVLFFPDILGIELSNAQLLADDFARNGFKVYAVDYFNGDAIPVEDMDTPGKVNLGAWFVNHGVGATRPPVDNVIAGLKEQGITQLAVTAYCFGARYAFDVAYDGLVKVVVVSHPSLLKIPQDLEAFKNTGLPLLINSCESDKIFPAESQAKADEILGGGSQSSALYRREYFLGCEHGFAVRGDLSIPAVKAGKEGSFKASVEFLLKHF